MIARFLGSGVALLSATSLVYAQEESPRYVTIGPLSGGLTITYTAGLARQKSPKYIDSQFLDLVQERRGGRTATSLGFGIVHHHAAQDSQRELLYVDLGLGIYGTQARSSLALGLGGKLSVGVETRQGYLAEIAYRVLPSASGVRPARNRITFQIGKRL